MTCGILSGPRVGLNIGECIMVAIEVGAVVEMGDGISEKIEDEVEGVGEGAGLSWPKVGDINAGLMGSGGALAWLRKESVRAGRRPRELERGGNKGEVVPAGRSTSLREVRPLD